jgi:hypothetical protein
MGELYLYLLCLGADCGVIFLWLSENTAHAFV